MSQKILVIDDEESLRFTFECFLEDEGYEVVCAEGYEEALTAVTEGGVDLILSDILLGGRTGIDLLREVKERGLSCPVVMVTGFPNIESAAEAVRLGAYDYLAKPVNQEALLRVARTALRYKKAEDERIETRANLDAVFRSVKDGIVTVDRELTLLTHSAAAERICGIPADAVGKNFGSLALNCGARCLDVLRESLDKNDSVEVERFECRPPHRPEQSVSLSASPLRDGRGVFSGAVMVVRDETKLHGLERDLRRRTGFHKMIGAGRNMLEVYSLLEKLAEVPTTVLITGESGTGKELVADALHYGGSRAKGPLVKVNCSALSDNLLESELFGHVRGAFTGALKDRAGRFQKAHGGTIFLDEIGDISPRMQTRLLRVLQERVVERVGDSRPVKVDVRVVAATNRDLAEKIREGVFREDLYYRLKVVNVRLPPLRDRLSDLPLLVNHFVAEFNRKLVRNIRGVSPAVERVLAAHRWPGNVRELEHVLEHAFIHCAGSTIESDHLPPELARGAGAAASIISQEGASGAETIRRALERTDWNKAKAARLLGMSRRTIYRKIEEFKISKP